MTERLDLDLLRAAADGSLPLAERRVLETRLRAEAGLAALAADLGVVLGTPDDPVPPCELDFDALDLDGDLAPDAEPAARSIRRFALPFAALAASLLAALGVLLFRGDGDRARGEPLAPVSLAAIPLEPLPDAAPLPVPAALSDYAPTSPAGLRFVEGFESGKAVARATGRPLVLFVYHPDCPLCRELNRTTFRAATVAPHADPFVLARAQVEGLDPSILEGVDAGWPIFLVYGPDGSRIDAFGGAPDAKAFATHLDSSFAKHGTAAAPLPWAGSQAVAKDLAAADAAPTAAERAARLASALEVAKGTPLEPLAKARSEALAREAQRALFAARDAASAGHLDEALAVLDAALARLRSTPFERDLLAVRERAGKDRAFPALEPHR